MSDRSSAEIIAFPCKPQDRLQRALAALDVALEGQRAAMASWRAEIRALKGAIGSLGESLHEYNASLEGIASRADSLGTQARLLEAWADEAIAKSPA